MTNQQETKSASFGYRINLVGAISFLVVLAWALVAVFAPWIAPHPVGEIVDFDFFGPTSAQFPLGTDYLGRDMLSRIIYGARFTVGISLAAVFLACFGGVFLGMMAAVVGGWFDSALSRFLDALTSIPSKFWLW